MSNQSEQNTTSARGRTEDTSSTEEEEPTEQEEDVELEMEEEQSQTQDAGQSTGESNEFADLPDLVDYVDDWMWIATFPQYELLSSEERDAFREAMYLSGLHAHLPR